MQIIKLDATNSTNLYLKNLSVEKQLADFTTVVAKHQLKGRGQMGTSWQSKKGKNLTFSVFKNNSGLVPSRQFAISMCTSLAVYNFLKRYSVPNLSVKWPNDIMSGQQKICGILIQNTMVGSTIKSSILGIGINVNQTDFDGLEKASSLKLIKRLDFDLDILLVDLLQELQRQFNLWEEIDFKGIREVYEDVLFRKNELSVFAKPNNSNFNGVIRGVSNAGKLKIEVEEGKILKFDLKEVSLFTN